MSKARGHVFTVQNYTSDDRERIATMAKDATYCIYGDEIAPTTGTPHLQGYVLFKNARKSKAVSNKYLNKAFTEAAKGNAQQNRTYCIKSGTFKEYGTCPSQGARNDLKTFIDKVKLKKLTQTELFEENTSVFARYPAFVSKAQSFYHPPARLDALDNYWYHGPPGTGKTHASKLHTPDSYHIKMANKWFDLYNDEKSLILEDIGPDQKFLGYFLKLWADLDPVTAEVKGGSKLIRPKHVIVTSNYAICEMGFDLVTTRALERRFQEVYKGDVYVPNPIHVE